MRTQRFVSISISLTAAAACAVFVVPQAAAKGRRHPPVMTSGTCSDETSTFTLKSQFDDEPFPQTVGAEFQVNTGVIGQTWQVTLTDNGVVFFDAPVETVGPEGGLNVTHPDQGSFAIAHTIAAQAVNLADGAECTGQVVDQPIQ